MTLTLAVCLLVAVPLIHATDYQRTVIAIEKKTTYGEYLFVRGGAMNGNSIPIKHNISPSSKDYKKFRQSFYGQTRSNDVRLGWGSTDAWQGVYRKDGVTMYAKGTPMIWTTNDTSRTEKVEKDGVGYWRLNTGGDNYWIVDLMMDCDALDSKWFTFKGYMVDLYKYNRESGWEPSSIYQTKCDVNGTSVKIPRAQHWNHYGICGNFNIVRWNNGFCMSKKVSEVEDNADFMGL